MAADDERRAEIEAVAQALYGMVDALSLTHARRAIAALDRFRDARGDDEATPACPECGCERSDWVAHDEATGIDYPDCPNCDTGQAPVSARSPQGEDPPVKAGATAREILSGAARALTYDTLAPQGEDHEAIAVCQNPNGEGHYVPADHIRHGRCFEVDCDCTPKVYVPAPSRDGTVAVEALRAIRTFAGEGPHTRMGEACGIDACIGCLIYATADGALAEFGPARAGESNEGDNQNDERRH